MNFTTRTGVTVLLLMVILNIILRYPVTSHEIGWDSFNIHVLANSVSEFGYAKWWMHPTSVFGLYPYSYASAVPFILSGISQCTKINMEWTIWLFCLIIGIFSAFNAHLMAGAIMDNDLFKYLVAFTYSTSAGVLWATTWTVTTRGLFIVILPMFIYLLLKCHTSKFKYCTLTLILLGVLIITHHLFYFILPVLLAYTAVTIFYRLRGYIKFDRIPHKFVYFSLGLCFLVIFALPFFTRIFIESGSRYIWLEKQLFEYARMIGLLMILTISGFIYLIFKHDKTFEEWFLLIALLIVTPLLYVTKYTKWFFLTFAFLLIGIALTNVAKASTSRKKCAALVILLLLSFSFTGYYQYLHFLNEKTFLERSMEEKTYIGGRWIKDYINKDKNMFAGDWKSYIPSRVFAISETATFTGESYNDLCYGFVNPNSLEIVQVNSPSSPQFYFHSPYREKSPSSRWYSEAIGSTDINNDQSDAHRLISSLNISYFVENTDVRTAFSGSVRQTKDNLYDNGKIRIWVLE